MHVTRGTGALVLALVAVACGEPAQDRGGGESVRRAIVGGLASDPSLVDAHASELQLPVESSQPLAPGFVARLAQQLDEALLVLVLDPRELGSLGDVVELDEDLIGDDALAGPNLDALDDARDGRARDLSALAVHDRDALRVLADPRGRGEDQTTDDDRERQGDRPVGPARGDVQRSPRSRTTAMSLERGLAEDRPTGEMSLLRFGH